MTVCNSMINIALTGNIAAGKSTVAELFCRWGATLIDADQLAREAQTPDSPVLRAIAERFGPSILQPDGALDRPRLRAMVMADPIARRALEAIVHPAVQALRQGRLALARARGDAVVVQDIPLLFEVAEQGGPAPLDPGGFDAVVLVDAPESLRLARLLHDRGLAESEARQLIAAQLPSSVKRAWRGGRRDRGAYVIENDGDRGELEARSRAVWEEIMRDTAA
ncbi:MAG: dephospho-CoA kinase [Gemmatimonadota bacterium]